MTFKKGDVVQRINKNYGNCKVGLIYTVAEDQQPGRNAISLKEYPGRSFLTCNFALVPQIQSAVESHLVGSTIDQHQPGAKLDNGKVRPSLIINGMARALYAVAEIGTFGAEKYTDGGWVHVPNGFARYEDAQQRHALERAKGHDYDAESQKLHLAHEAWNALAKLDLFLREQERVKVG